MNATPSFAPYLIALIIGAIAFVAFFFLPPDKPKRPHDCD